MARLLFPLLVGLVLVSCGGSQRGADTDWSSEPETKTKRLRETEALNSQPDTPDRGGPLAVLGVRHDLMLSATPHEARCACLSVEVGRAADPMFFWSGGAPEVSAEALVLAVGARGISCPAGDPDDRRRRPSISAVEQQGEDIFVEIEELPEGRPLASGAIIPRPGTKGGIFVHPRRGNSVYARNAGVARCRVR